MPKTLIIIPCYNERDNVVQLIKALFNENNNIHILVVDDSTDNTAELIREKQKNEPKLFLIKRQGKQGRGTAILAGFEFALVRDYQRVAEMDADFSHDPREFKYLMEVSGDDVLVIGSRYLKGSKIIGWPVQRKIFSRLANFYADIVLGIGIHDYTNGYRIYGRKALEKLDLNKIKGIGYIVLSEISYQLFKKGTSFVEIPTIFINRRRGTSNFSFKEIKEAFTSVIKIKINSNK